jgi:lysophospholipase L1-like esterase
MVFNNVVAETLTQVANAHDVRFYDAANDLKSAFGSEPGKYYFPDDMHFNPAGTRMYGMVVARFLVGELIKY